MSFLAGAFLGVAIESDDPEIKGYAAFLSLIIAALSLALGHREK